MSASIAGAATLPRPPARPRAIAVMAGVGVVTGLISSIPSPLPDLRLEDPDKIKSTVAKAFEQAHKEKRPVVIDAVVDRTAVAPTGAPPMDMPTRAKTAFSFMDPDDFPDEIKKLAFPDLK